MAFLGQLDLLVLCLVVEDELLEVEGQILEVAEILVHEGHLASFAEETEDLDEPSLAAGPDKSLLELVEVEDKRLAGQDNHLAYL